MTAVEAGSAAAGPPAVPPATGLLSSSALELAAAIRSGKTSAREVVELHLERIRQVNPQLNAVVTLCEERARERAAAADRAIAEGREVGPLHGVPMVVKDTLVVAGLRATAGSLLLADFVPERTAPAIARLEQAGAILLGKSNCPEFALDIHTDNRVFGATRNPLDPTRTPGGSSGGDAAAVASGCAALGIGTDYGGSIRFPAACTGLAALRPTVGLVPATGMLPFTSEGPLPPPNSMSLAGQLHTIAPIARRIADVWAAVTVMAGPDDRDLGTTPVQLGDPATVDVPGLAVAWCGGEGTIPVRPDLIAAVERAATALGRLGADVVEQRPAGFERAEGIYATFRAADGLPDHAALAAGREDQLSGTLAEWFAGLPVATVPEYRRAAAARDALRADVLEGMASRPILLLPVASIPAFVPSFAPGPRSFHVEGVEIPWISILAPCRVVSLLGLPAAVVRFGTSAEGLPVGVQVVGRPFHDHEVVAVVAALEALAPPDGALR